LVSLSSWFLHLLLIIDLGICFASLDVSFLVHVTWFIGLAMLPALTNEVLISIVGQILPSRQLLYPLSFFVVPIYKCYSLDINTMQTLSKHEHPNHPGIAKTLSLDIK
jgi:hypothetical protein